MAYLNKIDINGRTYYLQHLTDGKNEAKLPTPIKDDELLLRSQVINSVTSKDSQNGWKVPLSAAQGYSLNAKLNQEIVDREIDIAEEQRRAEDAEMVLTDNLNKEIQDRIDHVNAEETRALYAEKILTDNLAQEIDDRIKNVNEEQIRAKDAETALRNLLVEEIRVCNQSINGINDRAINKEKEIIDNLSAEVDRAKDAENTNAIAIEAEKCRAESVESDHESRIETMETFFKEADIDASQEFIDTLKEIQTYIAEDKTGAAAMAASIQANKTAIETESNRSKGVETDLQSKIIAEAETARAAEEANANAIEKLNGDVNTDGSVRKIVNNAIEDFILTWNKPSTFTVGVGSFTIPSNTSEILIKINIDSKGIILTLYIPLILCDGYPDGQNYRAGYYQNGDNDCGAVFKISSSTVELQNAFLNGDDVTEKTSWNVFYR